MIDQDTFNKNVHFRGSKGLVFIGDEVLVYRRDGKTDKFPYFIDVPGGGRQDDESPFMTFKREVAEEFGLEISDKDLKYSRKYDSIEEKGKFGYFLVAKLSAEKAHDIHFGTEGSDYFLMPFIEYLELKDAWPIYQERAADYYASITGTKL